MHLDLRNLGLAIPLSVTGLLAAFAVGGETAMPWSNRVIPLPKEITVAGQITVRPDDISYSLPADREGPVFETVTELLDSFAEARPEANTPEDGLAITLVLTSQKSAPIGQNLHSRLASLPNAAQAYAIVPEQGAPARITLAANMPSGLLYAVRTLKQLVRPRPAADAPTAFDVPFATVVDWPDIAQRGNWGLRNCGRLARMGQWKLNLYKLITMSEADADGKILSFNLAHQPEPELMRERLQKAAEQGFTVIPYISHLAHRSRGGWKGIALPVIPDGESRTRYPGFCMSNPAIIDLIAKHMDRMAVLIEPFGWHDIEVWLTENTDIVCHCDQCRGRNMYVLEAKGILKAFERVKTKHPGLRLRITLSQGSYRAGVSEEILQLLPPDVGVVHYGDAQTYLPAREPIIFPALKQCARSGRVVDVVPTVTPSWCAVFPASMPQFIHYRATEFADKGLTAVTSYTVLDCRYYDFNVAALGEWTWNAHGRTPREFARAYATVNGMVAPDVFSRWAVKQGEAAWVLARTRVLQSLVLHPDADMEYPVITRRLAGLAPDTLNDAVGAAREALRTAHHAQDAAMINESMATLAALESIVRLLQVNRLVKSEALDANPQAQKQLAEHLNELVLRAHVVYECVAEWDRLVKEKKKRGFTNLDNPLDARLLKTASAFLNILETYTQQAAYKQP